MEVEATAGCTEVAAGPFLSESEDVEDDAGRVAWRRYEDPGMKKTTPKMAGPMQPARIQKAFLLCSPTKISIASEDRIRRR